MLTAHSFISFLIWSVQIVLSSMLLFSDMLQLKKLPKAGRVLRYDLFMKFISSNENDTGRLTDFQPSA